MVAGFPILKERYMMNNTKTILIAEIDYGVISKINRILELMNFRIYPIVSRGQDLIITTVSILPSLIITNTHLLGQLDGIEAVARIKDKYKIPYIFITDSDEDIHLINSYYFKSAYHYKKTDCC